jgi:hypothetical protein
MMDCNCTYGPDFWFKIVALVILGLAFIIMVLKS